MRIMTVLTVGCAAVASFHRATMHARFVSFHLPDVTGATVDRFRCNIVVRMFVRKVGMTARAGVGPMHGSREFYTVHEDQNLFPGCVGLGERFIGMTLQAITVAGCAENRECQKAPQADSEESSLNHFAPDTHTFPRLHFRKATTPLRLAIIARILAFQGNALLPLRSAGVTVVARAIHRVAGMLEFLTARRNLM